MTTSKSLLATLDPQQRAAAEAPDGPVLIMGGPGVGKTHTILARVEMLIKKGVPPQSITVVAHDTRSAGDMRRRLVEHSQIADAVGQVRFSTMELCALDSLRGGGLESLGLSPGLRIWGPPLKADEIVRLVPPSPIAAGIAPSEIEAIREYIHLAMVGRKIDSGSVPQMWIQVLAGYLEERLANGVLDLDHLIPMAILAMEKNPGIRVWQEDRSRHLLVDDFQDITPVQYDLLKLMSGPSGSITVCADPDQSIEMRRGGAPHLVETLREDWPNIDIHHLRLDYRSTRALVRAANAWASRLNSKGLQSELQENARVEPGMAPTLVGLRNFPEGVSTHLVEWSREVRQQGFAWEDIAIICRDPSDLDRVRMVLEQHGFPHQTPGDTGREPDFDARRVINLLAWALNPDDIDAFNGAAFRESDDRRQNVNRRVADAIIKTAQSQGISLVEAADQKKNRYGETSDICLDLTTAISTIRDLVQMLDDPGASMHDICQRAAAPVREATGDGAEPEIDGDLAVLLRLSNTSWGTDHETPRQNLAWFLDQLNPALYPDRRWLENQPCPGGVTLLTVQEAKGLERKIICFIDAVDPMRPPPGIFSKRELLDEEDRILYVALTRAWEQFYYLGSESRVEEFEDVIDRYMLAMPHLVALESPPYPYSDELYDKAMEMISAHSRDVDQHELAPEPRDDGPAKGGPPSPALPIRARDAHDDALESIVLRLEQRKREESELARKSESLAGRTVRPAKLPAGRRHGASVRPGEMSARSRQDRQHSGDVPGKENGLKGWDVMIILALLVALGLVGLRWLGKI